MVAYEFYWRDPIKGYQRIGKLPERRTDPSRITQESITNWGKKILGEKVDANDIFFVKTTMGKNKDSIPQPNQVYRPLEEF